MADLPPTVVEVAAALNRAGLSAVPLRVLQAAAMVNALEQTGGNRTYAARALGISVRTLQRATKRADHTQGDGAGSPV